MKTDRHLETSLLKHFDKYKEILVLLGARQTGKTTLVKRLFPDAQYLLVDNLPVQTLLETYDIESYKQAIKKDIVIIDELHLLSDPGRAAKIIYDQINTKLIITGSSSFHIKNKTSESLAGRKVDYFLFPLTFSEYLFQTDVIKGLEHNILTNIIDQKTVAVKMFDIEHVLNNVLLYGLFPNMINNPFDTKYLTSFVDSVVFKDLLELNLIENKKKALELLILLSYQIGNLINYAEISKKVGIDQRTVLRYIEIFEQSYILFRLYPYSKNKRNELSKSPKIYFYDTGIRNALVNNFSPLNIRPDKGALFENFIISECIKSKSYQGKLYRFYFWRNKQKAEVDLIIETNEELFAVEIKHSSGRLSQAFLNRYPEAKSRVVSSTTFY
jgi:uncharacterized protein